MRLIQFLQHRLQHELPHATIEKEGLSPKLLALLKAEEVAAKAQFQRNPPRICAVMLAFYHYEKQWYLPMMKRPDKSRVHPGQIAFPGGRQEEVDTDLIDTAIREMEEEVGVAVQRTRVLGQLSSVYIPPSNSLVTPIVSFLEQPPIYTPDPSEVAEVLDVSLKDLRNPANKRIKKVILTTGDYLEMPAFQANDTLIWGGTARMIAEVNKLLKEMENGWIG